MISGFVAPTEEPPAGQGQPEAADTPSTDAACSESARLAAIVQSSSDAIIGKDLNGIVTSWNPAAERMYGYSSEEIVGHSLSVILPPDRLHELPDLCTRVAASECIESFRTERVRKDGTRVVVSLSISPVLDASGRIVGAATIARDVTEAVRREQELTEARRAIQLAAERHQRMMSEVLWSVTGGRLCLCLSESELPEPLPFAARFEDFSPEALKNLRRVLEAMAVERGFEDERWEDLVTAAGEAAMNALVHAGGGQCHIHCADEAIQVWIEDSGSGIDMSHIHRATLEDGYSTRVSFGHGFSLMLRTADCVWLMTGSRGTRVVILQRKHKPEPCCLQSHEPLGPRPNLYDSIPAL